MAEQPTPGVRLVRPPALYPGAPYAYASVIEGPGRLVLAAGACPLDAEGLTVGVGDVRAQARQALANLHSALAACDAGLADVVRTTIYVASAAQSDLVAAWEEIHDGFGEHEPPSTLVGVTVLGYRDQLVEIEAVAAVGLPITQADSPG